MFVPVKDKYSVSDSGQTIRTIIEAKLFEVSPVCFPAYPATQVSVRDKISDLAYSFELRTKKQEQELTVEELGELRAIWLSINAIINPDQQSDQVDSTQDSEPDNTTLQNQQSEIQDTTPDFDEEYELESIRRITEMRKFIMQNL